jgi:hypothetical protein
VEKIGGRVSRTAWYPVRHPKAAWYNKTEHDRWRIRAHQSGQLTFKPNIPFLLLHQPTFTRDVEILQTPAQSDTESLAGECVAVTKQERAVTRLTLLAADKRSSKSCCL